MRQRKIEIFGLFLLFIFIFTFLSLVSFSPHDPTFFHSGASRVKNLLGRFGATYAEALYQLVGLASFGFALFLFLWGVFVFKEAELEGWPYKIGGLFLFLLSLSILLEVLFPSRRLFGVFPAGGFTGKFFIGFLKPLFSDIGTGLLALFLFLLSLFSFQNFSLKKVRRLLRNFWKFLTTDVVIVIERKGRRTPSPAIAPEPEPAPSPEPVSSQEPLPLDLKRRRKSRKIQVEEEKWSLPLDFLRAPTGQYEVDREEIERTKEILEQKLREFKIPGQIVRVRPGPVITLYEFKPSPGVILAHVVARAEDLSLALGAEVVRVARVIGQPTIGIEVPNRRRKIIYLREIIESEEFRNASAPLTIGLGKKMDGSPLVFDLARLPHLLIGGSTGMGKSVALNVMILSLMYRNSFERVRFILIDPKHLEFPLYNGIPYLLTPVITEPKKAIEALGWAVEEMERRYRVLAKARVRNIASYQDKSRSDPELPSLPYIVIIIDELADLMLMASKQMEMLLARLAQMARAVGIHLIVATQRPSTDVITGTIKNNFPARIAFNVPSRVDSMTIIDQHGAEKLLDKGDLLFMPSSSPRLIRGHSAYVSEDEVIAIVEYLKERYEPAYVSMELRPEQKRAGGRLSSRDSEYIEAVKLVLTTGSTSATFLQRKLGIGFPKAARFLDMMEEDGILAKEGRKRVIVVDPEEYLRKLEGEDV